MVVISIKKNKTNNETLIKANGHSKISEVCNALSILLKYLELGLIEFANNCRVSKPKEGIFDIKFEQTEKSEILILTFIKTLYWLKTKYPTEINIKEV
ncbi:MAG TPA: ribosomal-processing cysteine protease Prp [bacterium]|nr:ribosomal-processing cysteine protease Prp [bacterium]HPP86469.1 ribosomal-processing cysteine protease Prp [bacterium]